VTDSRSSPPGGPADGGCGWCGSRPREDHVTRSPPSDRVGSGGSDAAREPDADPGALGGDLTAADRSTPVIPMLAHAAVRSSRAAPSLLSSRSWLCRRGSSTAGRRSSVKPAEAAPVSHRCGEPVVDLARSFERLRERGCCLTSQADARSLREDLLPDLETSFLGPRHVLTMALQRRIVKQRTSRDETMAASAACARRWRGPRRPKGLRSVRDQSKAKRELSVTAVEPARLGVHEVASPLSGDWSHATHVPGRTFWLPMSDQTASYSSSTL
jgi:hypothetical protein